MSISKTKQASTRAWRWAVLTMFFVNGAIMANWVSRIPQIQTTLAMSDGTLGLVLLWLAVGVLVALSMAGGLIARFGSRTVTIGGALLLAATMLPLGMMPNPPALSFNLFLFGGAMSLMDVAMNAQGVGVEKTLKRPVMSSFHAAYSIGGFVGAMMGAAIASLGIAPNLHFVMVAILFSIVTLLAAPALQRIETPDRSAPSEPVFRLPDRIIWPIGAVAFCSAIGEGAMSDWSGVYLKSVVGTTAAAAAYGYAAFSLTMTVGRLMGDYLTTRSSPALLVRVGGAIASLGVLLAILVPQVGPVLLGFAAVGAGLSIVVPLAFSVAGNVPGLPSGAAIAGVATIGYAGFLAGPPIIGLLAELTSLRIALLVVMLLTGTLIFSGKSMQLKTPTAES
ncbi:MAG: MFS transporter [Ardenticatenaceae bacterium]|nr:MFS transporter [Ardenticatenaceae bacterium]